MKISSIGWRAAGAAGAAWLAAACNLGSARPEGLPDAGDGGRFALTPVDAPPPTRADVTAAGPGALSRMVGPTRTRDVPPPAISGGTLLVLADRRTAVAADPDRDRVWFADLPARLVYGAVALRDGDEPGRLAADGAGRVHVALRRGGAVVTIDVATRTIVARRDVCPAPRGIAFDAATGLLHVACAGGELVSLRADGGAPTRALRLDRDLRDVVVQGSRLLVSRFRAAELLTVQADGTVSARANTGGPLVEGRDGGVNGDNAGVAWRTVARGAGALMLHQRALRSPVSVAPGGYGGGGRVCRTGVVQTALTTFGPAATVGGPSLSEVPLAVDVAVSDDGTVVALAVPGNAGFGTSSQLMRYGAAVMRGPNSGCLQAGGVRGIEGQVVAVAIGADNAVIAQTREPATLSLAPGVSILLSDESREDTGHRLFHSSGGAFVTCASCHPEGGDDGNVWNFTGTGPRRTQNLRGGLAGTAPFHWDGDMATFAQLADEVFVGRMSAGGLLPDQVAALERWVTTQPALPSAPPDDPAAVARGREVFADPTVGCATCHAGEHLTNNATVDVGTGGRFQVPSLQGVAARTPLLHNGCARTLAERFGACGGGESHGHTAQLLPAQLADLVAYLETL